MWHHWSTSCLILLLLLRVDCAGPSHCQCASTSPSLCRPSAAPATKRWKYSFSKEREREKHITNKTCCTWINESILNYSVLMMIKQRQRHSWFLTFSPLHDEINGFFVFTLISVSKLLAYTRDTQLTLLGGNTPSVFKYYTHIILLSQFCQENECMLKCQQSDRVTRFVIGRQFVYWADPKLKLA